MVPGTVPPHPGRRGRTARAFGSAAGCPRRAPRRTLGATMMTTGWPLSPAVIDARARPWGRPVSIFGTTASGSKGGLR